MTANQIQVTEGSGKSVATTTIGGVDFQNVIVAGSVLGSFTAPSGSIMAVNMPSPSMVAIQTAGSILSVSQQASIISLNAPLANWATYANSVVSASMITLVTAPTNFFYLTSLQISNTGATSANLTISSGGTVLAYAAAPNGGGGNITIPNGLKSLQASAINVQPSASSSIIYVSGQGFTSNT